MKIKSKNKIIVSTLALAMGAALVGSVSGSVAWYQYSTRTTASMTATSAGTSRNLQVKLKDVGESTQGAGDGFEMDWAQNITATNISNYLKAKKKVTTGEGNLAPVTTGEIARDAALPSKLLGHPLYQYPELDEAKGDEYFELELQFRCQDTEAGVAGYKAKDIYLVDADITNNGGANSKDISTAIRMHFDGDGVGQGHVYALASKSTVETDTKSKLDLNGDGQNDRDGFDTATDTEIEYGASSSQTATDKQVAYPLYDTTGQSPVYLDQGTGLLAKDTNAYDFDGGVALAKTTTDGTAVNVKVTIWLEGWAKLSNLAEQNPQDVSIWKTDYQNQSVKIDMRFACEADQ